METVLVIGAARSGIAASKLLKKMGYHVILTDMNPITDRQGLEDIEIYDNGHPDFLKEKEYTFIVKNPGINYRVPFVKYFKDKNVPIYTEIEIASKYGNWLEFAAVTGTDGKTTVTTLLYEMLKKKDKNALVAGNIGYPLSEQVLLDDQKPKDVAIELSNFQLLGMETFKPKAAVVTNLAPDHLDYMDSLEAYYESKMRIYKNMDKEDWFILNIDDPEIVKYAKNIPATIVTFSLKDESADLHKGKEWTYLFNEPLFKISDLKIVGDFNCGNAMMAAAMAYKMGVDIEDIRQVIYDFKGVEHRIEYVDTIDGVRVYNDTKATNTHAACAALSAFDKNVILLCGGKDKHISFDDLNQYDPIVKHCFSFGQTKDHFKDIFTHQTSLETMEEAFLAAMEIAKPGDVVLLSPACSSFDQFKNYEVRGEIFKDLVHEYAKRRNA